MEYVQTARARGRASVLLSVCRVGSESSRNQPDKQLQSKAEKYRIRDTTQSSAKWKYQDEFGRTENKHDKGKCG